MKSKLTKSIMLNLLKAHRIDRAFFLTGIAHMIECHGFEFYKMECFEMSEASYKYALKQLKQAGFEVPKKK